MSMIGLLGAPQTATAKAAGSDAKAAEGFGSTLQGALDALVEASGNGQGETEALPAGLPFAAPPAQLPASSLLTVPAGDAPAAAANPVPLVELGATPPVPSDAPASVGRAVGSETPTRDATPAAEDSADGSLPVTPLPLAPLVEDSTGSPLPAPADSVTESSVISQATPALQVGTPTGNSIAVSANSANVAAATPRPASPPAPPASTPPGASTSHRAAVDNAVPAPLVESSTTNLPPASPTVSSGVVAPAPATTLREAPVSTAPVQPATNASAEAAPAQSPPTVAAPAATPVSTPQQVASASAVTAPAAAASVPFATQLARPIFSLAAAGAGEHVMTVSVTPDNLGPVTVRAHVGADGVRVELFAPNDLGRDAIRAIIPELRRDLAGAGLGGNLSLSSQNQPSPDGSAHSSSSGQPGERGERSAAGRATASGDGSPAPAEQQVDRSGLFGTTSTIDVLA